MLHYISLDRNLSNRDCTWGLTEMAVAVAVAAVVEGVTMEGQVVGA